MTEGAARDWYPVLPEATDFASKIALGEIDEDNASEIIAEAAKLRGVDPPDLGSPEYDDLVRKIMSIGEYERDDLKRLGEQV